MKKFIILLVPVVVFSAIDVSAQGEFAYSVGGDVGCFLPFDSDYDGAFTIKTNFQAYGWGNYGLRATAGFFQVDLNNAGLEGDFDILYINGNLMYVFYNKKFQPYITGGLGIYSLDSKMHIIGDDDIDVFNDDNIEPGINAGGGVEFKLSRKTVFVAEAVYHLIGGDGPDSGVTLTGGVKFYY